MSNPSRRPVLTTDEQRPRSSSLSIARSPSVLSSGAFTTPLSFSLETDVESQSTHLDHDHLSPPLSPLVVQTYPPGSSSSTTVDDRLATSTSTPPSHRPLSRSETTYPHPTGPAHPSQPPHSSHAKKTVTLNPVSEQRYAEQPVDEDDEPVYGGGFQPPDSKEMISAMISFGAVGVLAVAAGLTTIYDWVL